MTSDQLNAFVTTIDAGSFSGASRRLYMTPQAVMHQINSLEFELGFKLLTRTAHGVSATTAGSSFYANAQQLLASMEAAKAQGRSVAQGKEQLCFAHCEGRMEHNYCLLELATAVSAEHPEYIQRHIAESEDPFDLLAKVANGDIDFLEWIEEPNIAAHGLSFFEVAVCRPRVLVASNHPLAATSQGYLELADLDGKSITLSSKYWFGDLIQDLEREAPGATIKERGCSGMEIVNTCMNQGVYIAWDIHGDDVPIGITALQIDRCYDSNFGFVYMDNNSEKINNVIAVAKRLFN